MERYTRVLNSGAIWPIHGVQDALKRLADYEDTGLEPGEVSSLRSMAGRNKKADLLRLEEYQSLGTIEHLRELVEADRSSGKS